MHNNVQKNHFIFLDLDSALRAEVGNASACLYLPEHRFDETIKFLSALENFQLVCFDSGEANKKLYQLCTSKKTESASCFSPEENQLSEYF